MSRPLDAIRSIGLDQRQWNAWLSLQKAALQFAAGFLDRGFRTAFAKEAFFEAATSFVESFGQPAAPQKRRRRRSR